MKSMRACVAAQQGTSGALAATRFKVRVPPSQCVTLAVPADIELGEAEVIVLHPRAKPAPKKASHSKSRQHPAFGLWVSRSETTDPVAFVTELRRRMMERRARLREARDHQGGRLISAVTIATPDDLLIAVGEQPTEFAHEVRLLTAPHHLQERRHPTPTKG